MKPIRGTALSREPEEADILSEQDLSARFVSSLRDLKAEPHLIDTKEATVEALASVVRDHHAKRIVVANLPAEFRPLADRALEGLSVEFLEELSPKDVVPACSLADVGVTWADLAIADDGAVIEVARDDAARLAASLPIVHVILLPSNRLVPDVAGAMAAAGRILRDSRPGARPTITFISGPSRTGDIELRLLYGVHGPHSLHVLLLNWYTGG